MFYDKYIDILNYAEGHTDNYGIWVDGEEIILKSIYCDVQPISQNLAEKVFGFKDKVDYRIFANIDSVLDTGVIISYKDKKYKIVKVIQWDDYIDMAVNDNGV